MLFIMIDTIIFLSVSENNWGAKNGVLFYTSAEFVNIELIPESHKFFLLINFAFTGDQDIM